VSAPGRVWTGRLRGRRRNGVGGRQPTGPGRRRVQRTGPVTIAPIPGARGGPSRDYHSDTSLGTFLRSVALGVVAAGPCSSPRSTGVRWIRVTFRPAEPPRVVAGVPGGERAVVVAAVSVRRGERPPPPFAVLGRHAITQHPRLLFSAPRFHGGTELKVILAGGCSRRGPAGALRRSRRPITRRGALRVRSSIVALAGAGFSPGHLPGRAGRLRGKLAFAAGFLGLACGHLPSARPYPPSTSSCHQLSIRRLNGLITRCRGVPGFAGAVAVTAVALSVWRRTCCARGTREPRRPSAVRRPGRPRGAETRDAGGRVGRPCRSRPPCTPSVPSLAGTPAKALLACCWRAAALTVTVGRGRAADRNHCSGGPGRRAAPAWTPDRPGPRFTPHRPVYPLGSDRPPLLAVLAGRKAS